LIVRVHLCSRWSRRVLPSAVELVFKNDACPTDRQLHRVF
jgi:hypothetical protein